MKTIAINAKPLLVEAYETYEARTTARWVRNSLTGKLYKEERYGKTVRYHIIEVIVDKETFDWLFGLYEAGEPVNLHVNGNDVEVVFTENEFRLSLIPGTDSYEGTIAFEEVQPI
jgi:hypothetical protein